MATYRYRLTQRLLALRSERPAELLESRLIVKLLSTAPVGGEERVLRHWRRVLWDYRAQQGPTHLPYSDSAGDAWIIDDALFATFDRVLAILDEDLHRPGRESTISRDTLPERRRC